MAAGTARPAAVLPAAVDYADLERLHTGLMQARQKVELFGTAVVWIHPPSREAALPLIAEALADGALVVDVLGSVVADPARPWPTVPCAMGTAQHRYQED
ncbi:hypothetical protein [Streptomyces sp. S186]|uniref:hypothetical protein n=1 Tax=Streptomyces sp. S186 TaxID=3434395 RepID=UPI003F663FE4